MLFSIAFFLILKLLKKNCATMFYYLNYRNFCKPTWLLQLSNRSNLLVFTVSDLPVEYQIVDATVLNFI